ncbi:acyl-CoA dehydrogenase family protein [Microbacterium immunditiarum]|uniref:Alkylation response protein AidB-like acyl-CoA dehydrogenase n=1 Tax=Microbacterium immunditiarum TaxID=337480 RepID=A0A7Y9GNL0_9MICO|nr:acyl-CoA dehydrogenase family protein [Microbacterium immunditiarum]NYE19662.1 alkylation response protein AidB-like acyl-CoA dehydrogenase [Microbacterium immunditiarum]
MEFELTADERRWREEVRAFLAEHLTAEVVAEKTEKHPQGRSPAVAEFWSRVKERGWHRLTWPKAYGGSELDPVRRMILLDEFEYWRAPSWDMTITSLAPVIIAHGTDDNREDWLPGIGEGSVRFALGYSEPNSGTDLASLRTSAVLDGDEWVINGEKIWNSGAHYQTHEWLAVRTGEGGPRGISIIIVPIDAPGVSVAPIWTWGDHRTNSTHFDNVRVPRRNLMGEVNKGWTYITAALENERGGLGSAGGVRRLLDDLVAELRRTRVDGVLLSEDPVVRTTVAEFAAELSALEIMNFDAALNGSNGSFEAVSATMSKVVSTELRSRIARFGLDVLGLRGQESGSTAPVDGWIEYEYRGAPLWQFVGGANEVMRDLIAQRGAGLPRPPRR